MSKKRTDTLDPCLSIAGLRIWHGWQASAREQCISIRFQNLLGNVQRHLCRACVTTYVTIMSHFPGFPWQRQEAVCLPSGLVRPAFPGCTGTCRFHPARASALSQTVDRRQKCTAAREQRAAERGKGLQRSGARHPGLPVTAAYVSSSFQRSRLFRKLRR